MTPPLSGIVTRMTNVRSTKIPCGRAGLEVPNIFADASRLRSWLPEAERGAAFSKFFANAS
jgi:hypothetical protein